MPKVSVIVPCYNVEQFVGKCLDSLVNQTLKEIEIIVVNDGSKDNTKKEIDNYVRKYPKLIKYLEKENGGLSSARNFGLKKATGDYIALIDSDDYVKDDLLQKMYEKAQNDNLDVVVCDLIVKTNDKEDILKSNLQLSNNVIKNYIISYPMAWSRLVRKTVMDNFSFREGIFYEDLDVTPSYVLKTQKIGFLDYAGYYYVQRTGSIMKQTIFNDKLLDIFSVLENNKKKLGTKYKDEVEYLYITHLLRSASLRFLDYPNTEEYLLKINQTMHDFFPNWSNNKYYKKSGIKLKLICYLAYKKHYKTLKFIKKLTGK